MADARSLLKAKRQEARISHPFATYTSSGQLKCSVCGTAVKHATVWEGHLGSKSHRTNVARMKEEQLREEQRQRERAEVEAKGKRKADDDESMPTPEPADKKRRLEPAGFPTNFFSDPGRALSAPEHDSDSDAEMDGPPAPPPTQPSGPKADVDLEYERFQRELLISEQKPELYEAATVFAEPVLVSSANDGFPVEEAAVAEEAPAKTDEEIRLQKQEEERELIMDRLFEEERAQEDADSRVSLMKARIEMAKKRREQKKAGKSS